MGVRASFRQDLNGFHNESAIFTGPDAIIANVISRLSGVVLKSGARSALGSLWPVSDNAAQVLLPSFYAYLKDAGASKAEALRRAQVELSRESGFRHPFYWSPFILVGAWL